VTKLTNLKKESNFERIKKLLSKYLLCRSKIKKSDEGQLNKGQKKIDDMTDENHQRELIKLDQLQFETKSYFIFSYDGIFRKLCMKIA
jgi:hypothetical protein